MTGLDNDYPYAALNNHWDTGIIAKPTLLKNERKPFKDQLPNTIYINCEMEGTLEVNCADGSDDFRELPFYICGFSPTIANIEKYIKACKKAINREVVTAGNMHIYRFKVDQQADNIKFELWGNVRQIIEDDAW